MKIYRVADAVEMIVAGVEYIKGDGKTFVVYGTDWEDEFNEEDEENNL